MNPSYGLIDETHRIRTTAYHPQANGLVQRLHRQLKAALTAHCGSHWVDILPVVLLGIRTTVKQDIGCSAAELVYGTTLRILGEFFSVPPTNDCSTDPTMYSVHLWTAMQQLRPVPTRVQQGHKVHVCQDLWWTQLSCVRSP